MATALWGMKKITKKQINFMWDYCQHHGLPYPEHEIEELG